MTTVADLFTIEYGHSLSLNKLTTVPAGDGYAYVSRTSRNNGVAAWIERPAGIEALPAGLLTVCLRSRNYTLATFIQPRPFFCGYHISVLRPKKPMTLQEKVWWAQCIMANRYRYNFGRQANRTLAALELPGTVPLWAKRAEVPTFVQPEGLAEAQLATDAWQKFRLDSLFDLVRGRSVLRRNMVYGSTPFVSASFTNNGITAMIDQTPDHPAGCITVASNGNSVGEACFQPSAFVASGDVTVLVPKAPITAQAALFICTLISADRYRWNYGRKWVTSRMKESVIRLPVTDTGQPDWALMAAIIESIPLAAALEFAGT